MHPELFAVGLAIKRRQRYNTTDMKPFGSSSRSRSRLPQPPVRSDNGQTIKALIPHGLQAFEDSFRRKYPHASREEILDEMSRYLNERTRFEYEHPRRSFRFGRHN